MRTKTGWMLFVFCLAVLAAATLTLGACGGGGDGQDPGEESPDDDDDAILDDDGGTDDDDDPGVGSWRTRSLDTDGDELLSTGIGVDAAGRLHATNFITAPTDYEVRLRYSYHDGDAWDSDTVIALDATSGTHDMAVDASGATHLVLFDPDLERLRYITNKSGSWKAETVDGSGYMCGLYNAIAVDADGNAHVAYQVQYEDEDEYWWPWLMYATNSSGSWVTEVIDDEGRPGYGVAIAADADGAAYVSYFQLWTYVADDELTLASNASGDWAIRGLETMDDAECGTGIALDSDGGIHIVYVDDDTARLFYGSTPGFVGTWQSEEVDRRAFDVTPEIVVDKDDAVHLAYMSYNTGYYDRIRYATNRGGAWDAQSAFTVYWGLGDAVGLAVSDAGRAYITFHVGAVSGDNLPAGVTLATNDPNF